MRSRKKKPKKRLPDTTVDEQALAIAVGKHRRTTHEYVRRGMPREANGRYDVERCRAWIAANIRPSGRPGAGFEEPESAGNTAYWIRYLTRERALREEYKRRQLEGDLIEVDLVARHNEQRITHAKALLEQIPDRVLGLLPKSIPAKSKKEFRNRVADMIEDALYALAEQQTPGSEGHGAVETEAT